MSDEHKQALAEGRVHARIVRDYLTVLRANRPRPGRKRTPASVQRRLVEVGQILATPGIDLDDPIRVLELIQERLDLTAELERMTGIDPLPALEERFVEVARAFGARKGISFAAWREMGVPAGVLERAGITAGD